MMQDVTINVTKTLVTVNHVPLDNGESTAIKNVIVFVIEARVNVSLVQRDSGEYLVFRLVPQTVPLDATS